MKNNNAIVIEDLCQTPDARVVVGVNVVSDFPRHVHNSYCIGIVDRGARLIVENKQTILIRKDEIFVINPGMPHRTKTVDRQGHSYRIVCIKPYIMQSVATQLGYSMGSTRLFPSYKVNDPHIKKTLKRFFSNVREGCVINRETSLINLLTVMMQKFISQSKQVFANGRNCEAVEKTCDYIRHNFSEKITLEKLSKIACLSPIYFQKVFLKEKGVTPSNYLHKIRLEKAQALLTWGADISEVSVATGFTDQSHFTRFFKRTMGITPGRYLQTIKKAAA